MAVLRNNFTLIGNISSAKMFFYVFRHIISHQYFILYSTSFQGYIRFVSLLSLWSAHAKWFISHHITLLIIKSLEGRDTHTHMHAHILIFWTKAILRNQVYAGLCLAYIWFKIFSKQGSYDASISYSPWLVWEIWIFVHTLIL